MATKQDCIAAAMKGGLSKAEAETAVSAMFEDKRLARAAVARGAEVSEEAALAKAWAVRMDDAAAAAGHWPASAPPSTPCGATRWNPGWPASRNRAARPTIFWKG